MEAVKQLEQIIEQTRSSLSPSQLRKLRRNKNKLLQQVVHEQLNADQPAAKRLCLDEDDGDGFRDEQAAAEPSLSVQLSGHGPGSTAAAAAGEQREVVSQLQHHQHQHYSAKQRHTSQLAITKQQQEHMLLLPAAAAAAGPTSSTSTGPCRTDLSGQLVVIQQELHSNDTGDNTNSTFSQLMLQQQHHQYNDPGAPLAAATLLAQPAGSDCSHGTHPAPGTQQAAAAAAAAGHQSQQQQGQGQQPHSRKRSRPSCQYGNYHHYYGYRLKPSGFEDPRLKVLDPSWFQGADVLDVGCNEGLVTLALAVHCGCRSVTGVDIDPVLVSRACTNLSRSRSQLNQQLHQAVRERNDMANRPRPPVPQIEPSEQQQSEQQQPRPAGPLGIIAASTMLPPAHKASSSAAAAAAAAAAAGGGGVHSSPPGTGSSGKAEPAVVASAGAAAVAATAGEDTKQPSQQQQQPSQQQPSQQQQQQSGRKQPQQHQQRKPPHAAPSMKQQQHQQPQRQPTPMARILTAQRQNKALSRVSFRAGNWLELPCPSNKYEVITCFSVTKWIQLNWGDDGIMKLFNKFYRCLAPGGLLVLEPQPFKSYKNAIHKPGVNQAPFVDLSQLKLRPEQFADYLTQRVGFELVQQLSAVSEAAGADAVSVKGFDRPIIVLRKPAARG